MMKCKQEWEKASSSDGERCFCFFQHVFAVFFNICLDIYCVFSRLCLSLKSYADAETLKVQNHVELCNKQCLKRMWRHQHHRTSIHLVLSGERSSHCWLSACLMSHPLLFLFHTESCVSSLVETWRLRFLLCLCCSLSARVSLPANWTFVFGIKLKSQHELFKKDWNGVCFPRWSSQVPLWRHVQVLSKPCGDLYWFKPCLRQRPYYCWIP